MTLQQIKNRIIFLLGGYSKKEMEAIWFMGVSEGRLSVDSLKFNTNYFHPGNAITQYDKNRSYTKM